MSHIRDAFRLMKHRVWTVLMLGLLLITPVFFFNLIFTNYFFRYYGALDLLFIAHFFRAFLVLLGLSVSQIPFIELAFRDVMGEDIRFKDGIRSILEHVFPVYIMGILYAFLSTFRKPKGKWVWITMRFVHGRDGTDTLPWPWLPMPF